MSYLLEHLTGGKKVEEDIKPKEFERYSDIMPESQFIPKKGDYWEDVSPTTKWRNLQQSLGGGQYAYDPERSQALVKSIRQFDPDVSKELRGGLSSRFFQVDHIVPLWAGGSDNPENKQTLTVDLHDKKTKVGAIARTLYYNKEINLSQAKQITIGWKNKDIEGIELDENGELASDSNEALVIAQHKKHEWDNPKEIKVSVGDVVEEMKRGWAGQLAGGAVSGFTGHWIEPYKFENEEKTGGEKVARFVGELGGMLAGLKGLGSILAKGAKKVGLSEIASSWLGKSRWFKGSDAAIKAGKMKVSTPIGMKVLQNAGLFTIHGQLSRQEVNTIEARSKRFLSDAAFGSLVSIPGNSLKGYAGLAGGVYALSAIEGATTEESLFNSALMVGFHALGHKSRGQAINDLAIKESLKFRAKFLGPDAVKKVEQDIASGKYREKKYTVEELKIENKKIEEFLKKEITVNDNITPEHIKAEMDKIIITSRQLYKGGLGVEKKLAEDIIDTRTLIRRENALKKYEKSGVPELIYKTAIKDTEKLLNFGKEKLSPSQVKFIQDNKANFVNGRMKVTGTATGMDGKDIKTAIDKGLKKGDNIILFDRSERMGKEISMKDFITAKNESKLLLQKTPNPENNIQVLVPIGEKIHRLGMAPSEARISTRPFNINEAMERFGMKEFDPKLNKDTLATSMKKVGVDHIVGKIEHITSKAKVGEEPSITIKITPESYAFSKGLTKAETIKKTKELKVKKASERIIKSTLTKEGRTFFTPIIKDIEKALSEKTPAEVKKYFKENLGVKLTDVESKNLLKKKEITVKETFNIINKLKENKRLDEKGENIYRLLFDPQGFYRKLDVKDKKFIDSLKLLGEKVPEKVPKPEKLLEVKTKESVIEKPDEVIKEEIPIKKEKDEIESIEKGEIESDKIEKNSIGEEIVVPEKKDTFEDWLNYEGGVHRGGGKAYDSAINKLREKGKIEEADALANQKNLLNKKNLSKYAKELYNKNGKNDIKGFEEFKKRYSEKLEKIGEKNLLKDFKNSQALKHHYHRLLQVVPVKRAFFKDGKLYTSKEKTSYEPFRDPDCFAGVEAIKKYKDNPIEIVRVDTANSKFTEWNPVKQQQEIVNTFEKNGYYVFGISKNSLKDIIAIKKNQKLINEFDKNPFEYIPSGEKIADYVKGKNEKTKLLRVYAQNVLGFPKGTSTDTLNKRIPLTHSYELTLPLKENIGVDYFVSPKVLDGKQSMFDGCTVFTENLGKKIGLNGGFIEDKACYKMTTAYRVKGYNNNKGNLMLMKNEVFVIRNNDKVFKPYFDKLIQERYGKSKTFEGDRAITFDENVKVGEEIFKKNNNFLEIPAKAFRYEYTKPHHATGTTSISMWGQFNHKDGINKYVSDIYKPEIEKICNLISDINNKKKGSVKELLKKYDENIEKGMRDEMILRLNNGENIYLANKLLNDIVNQIINKKVLHGSFIKGDHLTLIPDVGVLPGGKTLSTKQVVISKETFNKFGEKELKEFLIARFPIYNLTGTSKVKILIAEDLGITSLKKDCIIVSHENVYKYQQGDYDGDANFILSVGKKPNQIPQIVVDAIESRRIKDGEFKFEKQVPHEKTPFTYSNTLKHMNHVSHGNTGINHAMSTKRIMESLTDAGFYAETKNIKGKIVVDIFLGNSKKHFSYYNTNFDVPKNFVSEKVKVKFDKKEQEIFANLQQASLDSAKYKNLSDKMGSKGYDKNYIWEKILGTNNKIFINAVSKRVKAFQNLFKLNPKENKDIKTNEDMFKRIETGNDLTDLIIKSGGKIGPVQEIFKHFKNTESLKNYMKNTPENRKLQYGYDQAGRNAVIEKYIDKFDISKNYFGKYTKSNFVPGKTAFILDKSINKNINKARVYKVISEVKKLSEKHSRDYLNYAKEDIQIVKKNLRNEFFKFWNEVKSKLNKDEKEAIAYYLTTAYDANISTSRKFLEHNLRNKELLVYRLGQVYNEASSTVAKIYNKAVSDYFPEK